VAKAKKEQPKVEDEQDEARKHTYYGDKTASGWVTWAVKKIGAEAGKESVTALLKSNEEGGSEALVSFTSDKKKELQLSSYISTAKKKLGVTSSSTKSNSSGEATISDLKRARDFATTMKKKPSELLELVSQINAFGDLETLKTCLTALEELTG